MADRIDDLAGRVEVVEQKVGQLSASVDQRFDQMDQLRTPLGNSRL